MLLVLLKLGGHIIGCIGPDFCKETLVLKLLADSKRFAHFCTALALEIRENFVAVLGHFLNFPFFNFFAIV